VTAHPTVSPGALIAACAGAAFAAAGCGLLIGVVDVVPAEGVTGTSAASTTSGSGGAGGTGAQGGGGASTGAQGGGGTAPTCSDMDQNGGETDVDCGGPCPTRCAYGQHCVESTDCVMGICDHERCVPTAPFGVWEAGPTLDAPGNGRQDGAAAFDGASGHVVYFGGVDETSAVHDDAYELSGGAWSKIPAPIAPRPEARFGCELAYDTLANQLVMVFGTSWAGELADTWHLDGATWGPVGAANPPAQGRHYFGSAYDASRSVLVVAGGVLPGGGATADTWELDSATNQWALTAQLPSKRIGVAIAYDGVNGRVLAFGGANGMDFYDDFLVYSGSGWDPVVTGVDKPGPREYPAMTFDPYRGRAILYGGATSSGYVSELWEFDGASWQLIPASGSPGLDANGEFVFDPVRHRAVYVHRTFFGQTFEYYTLATPCDLDTDCGSGHCSGHLCCDAPCDQPGQSCTTDSSPGFCLAL
jgi:hypothetical protein